MFGEGVVDDLPGVADVAHDLKAVANVIKLFRVVIYI